MLSQRVLGTHNSNNDNTEGLLLAASGGNLDYLQQHFYRMSSTQRNQLTDRPTPIGSLLIVAIGAKQEKCAKFLLDYGEYVFFSNCYST